MEHADPDPAVVEVVLGSAVDRERQLAVPVRLDRPVPREGDRVVGVGCVDLDAEATFGAVDPAVNEGRLNRSPLGVADGDLDPGGDVQAAPSDVDEVRSLQRSDEVPGVEFGVGRRSHVSPWRASTGHTSTI